MEMSLFKLNTVSPHFPQGKTLLTDSGAKVDHASNLVAPLQITQDVVDAMAHICRDTANMERWARRLNWVKHLDAYRERTGATVSDVAKALDVSESIIYGLRTRTGANTSERVKTESARLFGVPVTEFVDDPAVAPVGIDPERWIETSERDRVIASAMFADITADQLTEAEKDELFTAYKEAKERILRLRKLHGSGPA